MASDLQNSTYKDLSWYTGINKNAQNSLMLEKDHKYYCYLKFKDENAFQEREDCLLMLDTAEYLKELNLLKPYYSLYMPQTRNGFYSYNLIWKYRGLIEIAPKVLRCFDHGEFSDFSLEDYIKTQQCLYAFEESVKNTFNRDLETPLPYVWPPQHFPFYKEASQIDYRSELLKSQNTFDLKNSATEKSFYAITSTVDIENIDELFCKPKKNSVGLSKLSMSFYTSPYKSRLAKNSKIFKPQDAKWFFMKCQAFEIIDDFDKFNNQIVIRHFFDKDSQNPLAYDPQQFKESYAF